MFTIPAKKKDALMRVLLLVFILKTLLYATPPMKSSDPFVPNLGQWEVNLAYESEKSATRLTQLPVIDINYGLSKNIELTFATAVVSRNESQKFDSTEFAAKLLLYKGSSFAMAINPKYINYPLDSVYHQGKVYELSLPMQWTLSSNLNLVMDTIYLLPESFKKHFEWGSFLQYTQDKSTYMIELFSDELTRSGTLPLLVNLGYTYQIKSDVTFLLSAGRELSSISKKATFVYSGFQLLF